MPAHNSAGDGLLTLPESFTSAHRKAVIASAERHRIPAIYPYQYFVTAGGLMSYGVDVPELYRQAASYVDRVLKRAKPGELRCKHRPDYDFILSWNDESISGLPISQTSLVDRRQSAA